ncbi:hypothetical protein MTR_5g073000 [Medicago truncatula]|uniref:Protein FAR1-RELATED SEQUENCE n=1 Tax=Medicago truncatula TaxID=3880 RepID=G7KEF1_MEDTR|nr:hypothetical protein MTR_5g073000 [Medicago truncatula]
MHAKNGEKIQPLGHFSELIDVSIDASNELPPNIEPPNVLSVVALEVIDDSQNAKPEVPPPKVDIPSGNAKAENAPSIVVPQDVVVSIDHQENFTIKQSFLCITIFSSGFERKRYLLIVGDWSLQVGDGRHNHDMEEVLKGHKIVGHLNPNESLYLHELTDSNIHSRKILTNLRKRNSKTSTIIKHIYNACHWYRESIRGMRTSMKYHDSDDVSDIFQAHPNGINLINTLPTVLVMGSIYKTNKYRLPLLEFVGNTSTEYMFSVVDDAILGKRGVTFSIGFGYMMYEKEDNVSHDRCRELLHSKDISPKVVVTNQEKCKTNCKVKDLKGKDGKEIKSSEVVKMVMVAWEDIMNSDTEQTYVDNCNRFKVVQRKVVVARLIQNIPRNALHYLAIEVDQVGGCSTDKYKCGCLIFIAYRFPCACTIARFKDVDYNMKVRIKEQFRQFSLQEMTSMRRPPKKVTLKELQRKINISFSQQNDHLRSGRLLTPRINKHMLHIKNSTGTSRESARKSNMSPNPPKPILVKVNIPHKDQIPYWMHEFIEKEVDVAGDGHCGVRAVADLRDMYVDARKLIYYQLHKELIDEENACYR